MTINEFISSDLGKRVRYEDFYYGKVVVDESLLAKISYTSILDKYDSIMNKYKTKITLTAQEAATYIYSPKRMSNKLYGTNQYWFLLIHANQMKSATEFDFRNSLTMYAYNSDIVKIINEIINVDKPFIQSNDADILKDTKTAQNILNSAT